MIILPYYERRAAMEDRDVWRSFVQSVVSTKVEKWWWWWLRPHPHFNEDKWYLVLYTWFTPFPFLKLVEWSNKEEGRRDRTCCTDEIHLRLMMGITIFGGTRINLQFLWRVSSKRWFATEFDQMLYKFHCKLFAFQVKN